MSHKHGQIAAAGDAVAHDGRDLRNARGRDHGVVAKDAAEVVFVGKDLVLQRQKDAGRIDQVDSGRRLSRAIRWARSTFLAVVGKKAPALTVASLAMIMSRRPATWPMPETTPAAGAPPQSAYISQAAHRPSSKKRVPGSIKPVDALAGREPALGVLPFNGGLAAAGGDFCLGLGIAASQLTEGFSSGRIVLRHGNRAPQRCLLTAAPHHNIRARMELAFEMA